MNEAELAYAAGVLDILGSLRVRTTPTGSELPSVSISTTNAGLLNWLGRTSGTEPFVVKRSYDRFRCIEHCDEAHEHLESVTSRWNITGVRATVVLYNVAPHMVIQKEQAERLVSIGIVAAHKPAVVEKMRALGWPLPEEWNK